MSYHDFLFPYCSPCSMSILFNSISSCSISFISNGTSSGHAGGTLHHQHHHHPQSFLAIMENGPLLAPFEGCLCKGAFSLGSGPLIRPPVSGRHAAAHGPARPTPVQSSGHTLCSCCIPRTLPLARLACQLLDRFHVWQLMCVLRASRNSWSLTSFSWKKSTQALMTALAWPRSRSGYAIVSSL